MPERPPSPFEAVLKRTRATLPEDEEDGATGASATVRSTPWYVPERARSGASDAPSSFAGLYDAEPAESGAEPARHGAEAPSIAPEAPAPAPGSVDPDDIARELALEACAGLAALKQRRRLFAAANHPDRVDPRLRENATARMKIANRLVDQEISRRKLR